MLLWEIRLGASRVYSDVKGRHTARGKGRGRARECERRGKNPACFYSFFFCLFFVLSLCRHSLYSMNRPDSESTIKTRVKKRTRRAFISLSPPSLLIILFYLSPFFSFLSLSSSLYIYIPSFLPPPPFLFRLPLTVSLVSIFLSLSVSLSPSLSLLLCPSPPHPLFLSRHLSHPTNFPLLPI